MNSYQSPIDHTFGRPPPAGIRTALVGGGAGGIGAATALALVRTGHRVVLAGRTAGRLAATASTLGDSADYIVCDLADPAAVTDAVAEVHNRHGSLDVVVANAGGPALGRVLNVPDEQWHRDLDLLLLGPLALMRAALPAMAARGFGRVIVLTSTAVRQPQPQLATSTVLRSAMTAAAKLVAREYATDAVTVNCVAPGATLTPRRLEVLRGQAAAKGMNLDDTMTGDNADIPAKRAANPAEVAAAVAFLASPEAAYVNGTTLTVDGGRTEYPL
ncbi:SDR family oxidoreductase [Amycolatopsis sp. NPDC049868]|uniref:SDR family oxidoreductase n=1 Tax=Amycolatopsis sp. NPDC049868 TaxID=3363934 RepID=UPI00379AE841